MKTLFTLTLCLCASIAFAADPTYRGTFIGNGTQVTNNNGALSTIASRGSLVSSNQAWLISSNAMFNATNGYPWGLGGGTNGGSGGTIVDRTDIFANQYYTNSTTSNLLVRFSFTILRADLSPSYCILYTADNLILNYSQTSIVGVNSTAAQPVLQLEGNVLPGGRYYITNDPPGDVFNIQTGTSQRIYTSGGGGGGGGGSGVTNGQILTDAVLNGNTIIANATVTNLNAQFVSGGASLLTNANATTLFGPPSGNVTLGQTGTNIGGYIQLNTNLGGTFALNSGNLSSIVGTPSKLTLTAPNITGIGTFNGDGGGMTNVNASTLNADIALYRLSNTNCFFGWMGDSIVAGSTLSNSWALSDRAARLDFFKGRGITTNISVGGSGVTNALDRYYSIMGPLLRSAVAAGRDSYVFCNSMVNDIASGYVVNTTLSVSNWYFQRFLIESNVVFDGGKMVEIGGLYYSNVPYSTVEIINALNKAMREQTNGYVYAYVPSRSVLPSPLDTNLFQGDFLHPTYKGQDVLAHLINSTMLEQGMHQYGEAYAMNINRLNTDDRNLAIGSGADAGTRFQLAASSDRTIDSLISFTFGTPANSKDISYLGVVGSAGNSFTGSKANDTFVAPIGGKDFVIATGPDTSNFQTQRVRVDLNGLATFYGGATVAGGQFTGSGAGVTNVPPSAISSNGTYFANGTLATNSGAGGSLAGPFLTEAGANRAYSYNAQSLSNGVPLASLGPNSLLSSNSGAALIAALASGGSSYYGPNFTNITIYGSGGGTNWTTTDTNGWHNTNSSAVNQGVDISKGNIVAQGSITASNLTAISTNNDSAAAGYLGEFVSSLVASGSAIGLVTASGTNVTSISLTRGDWDVSGNVNFSAASATVTGTSGGISTTSATVPTDGSEVFSGVQVTILSETDSVTLPRKRISIAVTTTVYLTAKSTFSAGTVAAFGQINARRVR